MYSVHVHVGEARDSLRLIAVFLSPAQCLASSAETSNPAPPSAPSRPTAARTATAARLAETKAGKKQKNKTRGRSKIGKREKKKEVNVMDERRQKRLEQLEKARQKSENRKTGGKAARPVWDALDRFAPKKIKKKVRG